MERNEINKFKYMLWDRESGLEKSDRKVDVKNLPFEYYFIFALFCTNMVLISHVT